MILSKTSEYAIRAAVTMATICDSLPIGAQDLSKITKIPPSYLSKILRKLVEARILKVKKGPVGGFSFNKPLNSIALLSILKAVEFELKLGYCPFGWSECNSKAPCPLHSSYEDLKKNYIKWAQNTTLDKICEKM